MLTKVIGKLSREDTMITCWSIDIRNPVVLSGFLIPVRMENV